LSEGEMAELRKLVDGTKVVGERYGEVHRAWVGH
jgi:hypothetical protein